MFTNLYVIFVFSLLPLMASCVVYFLSGNTSSIDTNMSIALLITFGTISLIILLHMILALAIGFCGAKQIEKQTQNYTEAEFLKYIDAQKDVPTFNTTNVWLSLGYAVKEYIYKGKVNRKHIAENIFKEKFSK